jgi:hypothetical protein
MQNNFLQYAVVNGFPNYWIFSNGTCQNIKSGRFLKPYLDKRLNRYHYVLSNKGETKTIRRYRLVAMNLLPNPQNLPEVDHIDGKSTNDDISNLRWVTSSDNMHNLKETTDTGVSYIKRDCIWRAQICVNNKQINLGSFKTKLEAQEARAKGKIKYHTIV